MMRTIFIPLSLILTVVLSGCSDPPQGGRVVALDDLPQKRILTDHVWRDGWRLPPEEDVIVDLGPLGDTPVLRLGFLRTGADTKPSVKVYVGETRVKSYVAKAETTWRDIRLDLSRFSGSQNSCRIVFSDSRGITLGPCELVSKGAVKQPNVLVFLVDTLRKDHLGCYGYDRQTSPNIDALAEDGIRFDTHMPQSTWTRPSVASLFTSLYPSFHGAEDWTDKMREDVPTLGAALAAAGYESHALFTNPNVLPVWGMGDEFTRVTHIDYQAGAEVDDARVVNAAISTIQNTAGRPWFIYAHTMAPHDPYEPPAPYDTKFARVQHVGTEEEISRQKTIEQYDGEIGYVDEQFGRLVAELKRLGQYDNTLIVLLSDHGEEFWEHGGEIHGTSLYEELLGVPLIVKLPGNESAGKTRAALVQTIDIAPTILELVGAAAEPRFQGASFTDIIGDPMLDTRIGFASLVHNALSMRAAREGGLKFVHDNVKSEEFWLDVVDDPAELKPIRVAPEGGEVLQQFVRRMAIQSSLGFHLLITCGSGEEYSVTGEVSSETLSDYQWDYYDWKGKAEREGDTVRFEMQTKVPYDEQVGREQWHDEFGEQQNAHLRLDVDPNAPLTIRIEVDGQPVSTDITFGGLKGAPVALADATLVPLKLTASPDAFDPAKLPRKFAIYVWYVADSNQLSTADLDADTVEALRGLGYVD